MIIYDIVTHFEFVAFCVLREVARTNMETVD